MGIHEAIRSSNVMADLEGTGCGLIASFDLSAISAVNDLHDVVVQAFKTLNTLKPLYFVI